MSEAVFTPSLEMPRQTGRLAGFFWLLTILTGSVAMFTAGLVVMGNPAATAANISGHESLYRFGVASDLLATVCYLAATLFIYDLLRPVSRNVSLLAAFFSIVGCAVSCLSMFLALVPLVLLHGAKAFSVFSVDQLQALALAFLRVRAESGVFSFTFFGLHCFLTGILILKSKFMPRAIGILMICAGLGWLTFSFTTLLAPPLGRALSPWILFPGILGESSLTIWLLAVGVSIKGEKK